METCLIIEGALQQTHAVYLMGTEYCGIVFSRAEPILLETIII